MWARHFSDPANGVRVTLFLVVFHAFVCGTEVCKSAWLEALTSHVPQSKPG